MTIPAGILMVAVVVAVAIPIFLGAHERVEQRQAAPIEATQPRLATPEAVAGLRRNTTPAVAALLTQMAQRQQAAGFTNAIAAVYGPDTRNRAFLVNAIRTSSTSMRATYLRSARVGVLAGAKDPAVSPTTELARTGVTFQCITVAANPGRTSALCTWDDGDTAGLGVGYGGMPAGQLADLLAQARPAIQGT